MRRRGYRMGRLIIVVFLFALAAALGVILWLAPPPTPTTRPAATAPSSRPAAAAIAPPVDAPAATVAAEPTAPRSLADLAGEIDPRLAAAGAPASRLPLDQCAAYVLDLPVHLAGDGSLWIADPRVAARIDHDNVRLVPRPVLYVARSRRPADARAPVPLFRAPDGVAVERHGRSIRIGARDDYRFDHALPLGDRLLVPTARGASLLDPSGDAPEQHLDLADAATETRLAAARRGVIAFARGGRAAWFTLETSALLNAADWPPTIVALAPMGDGSVLQVRQDDTGDAEMRLVALESTPVDEAQIAAMVARLSDPDPAVRQAAEHELLGYGEAHWPALEGMLPGQPPEAQVRLRRILRERFAPSLGGLRLAGGPIEVASELADGGVVVHAPEGVLLPRQDQDGQTPRVRRPGLVALRPGRAVGLVPPLIARDYAGASTPIDAWGDEWIISLPGVGPRRLMGNHLSPLAREDGHRAFTRLLGVDARGRWLLRDEADPRRTLVIDPWLPDPTPRLASWTIPVPGGRAGWTANGWPVIERGGAWVLREAAWQALPPDDLLSAPAASDAAVDHALLRDDDDATWSIGADHVVRRTADGAARTIALPPGDFAPHARPRLVDAGDRGLFLLDRPGRVLRLTPGPDPRIDAVFVAPTLAAEPVRAWLDPAGRLAIVDDAPALTLLFVQGPPPRALRDLIPAGELRELQSLAPPR